MCGTKVPLKLMGVCDCSHPGLERAREHDPPFRNTPQMPPQIAVEANSVAEGLKIGRAHV